MKTEKSLIDEVVARFYKVFCNKDALNIDMQVLNELCISELLVVKKYGLDQEIYDLKSFLEPRVKMLRDGTLKEFEEYELEEQTIVYEQIASRYSIYEKKGIFQEQDYYGQGTKFFQFIKLQKGWRISAIVWQDHMV